MRVNKRFFEALMQSKEISLRSLAKHLGLSHSQLSLTFSGARRMQLDEAVQLSQYFGVSLQDIAANAGASPVNGISRFCNVALIVDDTGCASDNEHTERAYTPSGLPDEVAALQIRSSKGALAWLDRWLFYYRPTTIIEPSAIGQTCLMMVESSERILGVLSKSYTLGKYDIQSSYISGTYRIKWATPLLSAQQ
jgi:transcriptional regulator with XRE-family HTH domain